VKDCPSEGLSNKGLFTVNWVDFLLPWIFPTPGTVTQGPVKQSRIPWSSNKKLLINKYFAEKKNQNNFCKFFILLNFLK